MSSSRIRALVTVTLLLAAMSALSACGSGFMESLDRREAVVVFEKGTERPIRLEVRQACADVPHTTPAPLPSGREHKATRLSEVRYRVDDATDRELRGLYDCLHKFDSVIGVKPGAT